MKPLVSIIIPTYNSGDTLELCLKSIKNQSYKNIEVIIVDNYSQDETETIAKRYKVKFFKIKGSLSTAKRYGITQAKGDFIFFLDADQILERDAVEICVSICLNRRVDALEISESSIASNFWGKCIALSRNIFEGSEIVLPRFLSRKVFEKLKIAQGLLFGEDYAIYLELRHLGLKLIRVKKCLIKHFEDTSLKSMIKKYYKYGKSAITFSKRYGLSSLSPYALYGTTNFIKRFITSCKTSKDIPHIIGLLIVKLVRTLSFLIGFIVKMLL